MANIHEIDISIGNQDSIKASKVCGCYYCLEIFESSAVYEWIKEMDGKRTAKCPLCNIDSVIGDQQGEITKSLLEELYSEWFKY